MTVTRNEDRLRAIKDLIKSLKDSYPERGFKIHPKLKFITESKERAGVKATIANTIDANEILLVIPEETRLSFKDSTFVRNISLPSVSCFESIKLIDLLKNLKSESKEILREGESHFSTDDFANASLVMFVLSSSEDHERIEKIPKVLRSQVKSWPSDEEMAYSHPLFWGQNVISVMKYNTFAYELLLSINDKMKQVFDSVLWPVLKQLEIVRLFIKQGHVIGNTSNEKILLWKTFQYSFALIFSRVHEDSAIIPLVELFNGLPDTCNNTKMNVEFSRGQWPFLKGNVYKNECNLNCSAVYATRRIEAGEELFISYGDCTVAEFLIKYGVIPEQMLDSKIRRPELVTLWYPPSLAPPAEDHNRILALKSRDYPTTHIEIQDFSIVPSQEALEDYGSIVGGVGKQISHSYTFQEDGGLKMLRHYAQLAHLLDEDGVETNLRTGSMSSGRINTQDIGILMVKIVDYNLNQLTLEDDEILCKMKLPSVTLDNESTFAASDSFKGLEECTKLVVIARDCYKESLARWRHIVCRRYGLHSWMDKPEQTVGILPGRKKSLIDLPKSLNGVMGCPVCGRIKDLRTCSRCKIVKYCCRDHQKNDFPFHKKFCTPTKKDTVNQEM